MGDSWFSDRHDVEAYREGFNALPLGLSSCLLFGHLNLFLPSHHIFWGGLSPIRTDSAFPDFDEAWALFSVGEETLDGGKGWG